MPKSKEKTGEGRDSHRNSLIAGNNIIDIGILLTPPLELLKARVCEGGGFSDLMGK